MMLQLFTHQSIKSQFKLINSTSHLSLFLHLLLPHSVELQTLLVLF